MHITRLGALACHDFWRAGAKASTVMLIQSLRQPNIETSNFRAGSEAESALSWNEENKGLGLLVSRGFKPKPNKTKPFCRTKKLDSSSSGTRGRRSGTIRDGRPRHLYALLFFLLAVFRAPTENLVESQVWSFVGQRGSVATVTNCRVTQGRRWFAAR